LILLVGHYDEPNPARACEYAQALARNCSNRHIEKVWVFFEDASLLWFSHSKIWKVPHGARLKFCDLFDIADRELAGKVCIIANSDIYFDDSLGQLRGYDLRGKLLALSRWETTVDGKIEYNGLQWSQDAWIFRPPIIVPIKCDFPLGILACDTRLNYEARAAGLEVLNPCKTIRAIHLHMSAVRNYTLATRLGGKEAWVQPQALHDEPPELAPADPKLPLGFNPYTALQNGLLPIVNLHRKF
jgi:hypothetical protein